MELKLKVIQGQDLLSSNSSVIVDADVFSIGRGHDNSWVLPDPKLHISNKHCVIHRKNDEYHLTDISTNGVYLNGLSDPLGRGRSQVLKQGDQLHIGEYVVQVLFSGVNIDATATSVAHANLVGELDSGNVFAADIAGSEGQATAAQGASDVVQQVLAATSEAESIRVANGADLTDELLGHSVLASAQQSPSDEPTMSELLHPISPERAYYAPPKIAPRTTTQPASADEAAFANEAVAEQNSVPVSVAIPDNWLDLAQGHVTVSADVSAEPEYVSEPVYEQPVAEVAGALELAQSAPTIEKATPHDIDEESAEHLPFKQALRRLMQPVDEAVDEQQDITGNTDLFELMIEEAGLSTQALQGKDRVELARQMGRMLRNFAQGAIDTLATRSMVKSEFRLQQTMIRPTDNNPLKLSPSGTEALKLMLAADSSAYLSADCSIQESFKDIQAHQLAMMSGIQAAFSHLLNRFEPQKLEQKFVSRPRYSKGILGRNKTDLWREYQDYYLDVCAMMEDEFQDLFSNEFGKAYESQLRKLR